MLSFLKEIIIMTTVQMKPRYKFSMSRIEKRNKNLICGFIVADKKLFEILSNRMFGDDLSVTTVARSIQALI